MSENILTLGIHLPKNGELHTIEVSANTPISAVLKSLKQKFKLNNNDLELFLLPYRPGDPGRWLSKTATFASESVYTDSILNLSSRHRPHKIFFPDGSSKTISLNSNALCKENVLVICKKSGLTPSPNYCLFLNNNIPLKLTSSFESQLVPAYATLKLGDQFGSYHTPVDDEEYLTSQDLHYSFTDHQIAVLNSNLIVDDSVAITLAAISLNISMGPYDSRKHSESLLDDNIIMKILPRSCYYQYIPMKNKSFKNNYRKLKNEVLFQYSLLNGTSDEMKLKYTELCQKSESYGKYFYPCYINSKFEESDISFLAAVYDHNLHLFNMDTLKFHSFIPIDSIKEFSFVDSLIELVFFDKKPLILESSNSIQIWFEILREFSGTPNSASFILKGKTPVSIAFNMSVTGSSTKLGNLKKTLESLYNELSVGGSKFYVDKLSEIATELELILEKSWEQKIVPSKPVLCRSLHENLHSNYYKLYYYLVNLDLVLMNEEINYILRIVQSIMRNFLESALIIIQGSRSGDQMLHSLLLHIISGVNKFVSLCKSIANKKIVEFKNNPYKITSKIRDHVVDVLNLLPPYYFNLPNKLLHLSIIKRLDSAIDRWCKISPNFWVAYVQEHEKLEYKLCFNHMELAIKNSWNVLKKEILKMYPWMIDVESFSLIQTQIVVIKNTLKNQFKKINRINQINFDNSQIKTRLIVLKNEHNFIKNLIDQLNWTGIIYLKSKNYSCTQFFQSYIMAVKKINKVFNSPTFEKAYSLIREMPNILHALVKDVEVLLKTNETSIVSNSEKSENLTDSPDSLIEDKSMDYESLRSYYDSVVLNINKIEAIIENPYSTTLVEMKQMSHDLIFQITNLIIYLTSIENNNKVFVELIMTILYFISEFMSVVNDADVEFNLSSNASFKVSRNLLNKNMILVMKNLFKNNFYKYFLKITLILPEIFLCYEKNRNLSSNEWNCLQQNVRILKTLLNPQIQLLKLIQAKHIIEYLKSVKKHIKKAERKLQLNSNSSIDLTKNLLKSFSFINLELVSSLIEIYCTVVNGKYDVDVQFLLKKLLNSTFSLASHAPNNSDVVKRIENIISYLESYLEVYLTYLNNNNKILLWKLLNYTIRIIQQVSKLGVTNFYTREQLSNLIYNSIPLLNVYGERVKINSDKILKDFTRILLNLVTSFDACKTNSSYAEQEVLNFILNTSYFGKVLSKTNFASVWFKYGIKSDVFIKNHATICECLFEFVAKFITEPSELNFKFIINAIASIFNNLPNFIGVDQAEKVVASEIFKYNDLALPMKKNFKLLKVQLQNVINENFGWNYSPGHTILNSTLIMYYSKQLTYLLYNKLICNDLDDTIASVANKHWQLIKNLESGFDKNQISSYFVSAKSSILKLDNYAQSLGVSVNCQKITDIMNSTETLINSLDQKDLCFEILSVNYCQLDDAFFDLMGELCLEMQEKNSLHYIFIFLSLVKKLIVQSYKTDFETEFYYQIQIYCCSILDLIDQISTHQEIKNHMWLQFVQRTIQLESSAIKNLSSAIQRYKTSPLNLSSTMNNELVQKLSLIKQIFSFDKFEDSSIFVDFLRNINLELLLSEFQSQFIVYLTVLSLEDRLPKPDNITVEFQNSLDKLLNFLESVSKKNLSIDFYTELINSIDNFEKELVAELIPESVYSIENFLTSLQELEQDIENQVILKQDCDENTSFNSSSWNDACKLGHNIFQCFNSIFQDYLSPDNLKKHLKNLSVYLRLLCTIIYSCGKLYTGPMYEEITSHGKAIIDKFRIFMESLAKTVKNNSSAEDSSFPFSQASRSVTMALNVIQMALNFPQESILNYLNDLSAKIDSILFSYETENYPSNEGCWHDSFGDQYLKNLKNIESLLLTSNTKNSLEYIKSGPDLLSCCWDSLNKILPFGQLFPISMNMALLNYFKQILNEFSFLIIKFWPVDDNESDTEKANSLNTFSTNVNDIIMMDTTKSALKAKNIIETEKMINYRKAMNYSNSVTPSTSTASLDFMTTTNDNDHLKQEFTWEDLCKRVSVLYQYSTQYVDQLSWVWRLMKNYTLEMIEHGAQAIDQLSTVRAPDTDVNIDILEEKVSRACSCFELTWDRQYHFGSYEICRKEMGLSFKKKSDTHFNKTTLDSLNNQIKTHSAIQNNFGSEPYRTDELKKNLGVDSLLKKHSFASFSDVKNNSISVTVSPCSDLVFIHASAFQQSLNSFEKLITSLIELLQVTPIVFKKIFKHCRQGHYNKSDNALVCNTSKKLANQLNKVIENCILLMNAIKICPKNFKSIFLELELSISSLFQTLRRLSFPILFFELEDINSIVLTKNTQSNFFNWCSDMLIESRKLLSQSSKSTGQQLLIIQQQNLNYNPVNNLINNVKKLTASGRNLLAATNEIHRVNLKLSGNTEIDRFDLLFEDESFRLNNDGKSDVEDLYNVDMQSLDQYVQKSSSIKDQHFSLKVIEELVSSCASGIVSISFLLKHAACGEKASTEHLNAALSALNYSLYPINNLIKVFITVGGQKLDLAVRETIESSDLLVKTALSLIEENSNKNTETNINRDTNKISSKKAQLEQRAIVQNSQKVLDENREILRKLTSKKAFEKTKINIPLCGKCS